MKVFFLASPSKINIYKLNYQKIAELIKKLGHEHTCQFIINFNKSFFNLPKSEWSKHYQTVINSLLVSDVAVFDITVSSLAIGQLLQYALINGKPVIALHTKAYNPIFLSGATDSESKLQFLEYSLENIDSVLKEALVYAQEWLESRFTLILTPSIKGYLDKMNQKGVSRSEYIRQLIIKDMKEEKI
ncbi:hypothetical protein GYA49_01940 [Candidatus Beckwithbacteria bacterium]|nr:hypothetical protein [Candidatus Beckwithbacteria bacterium]